MTPALAEVLVYTVTFGVVLAALTAGTVLVLYRDLR